MKSGERENKTEGSTGKEGQREGWGRDIDHTDHTSKTVVQQCPCSLPVHTSIPSFLGEKATWQKIKEGRGSLAGKFP